MAEGLCVVCRRRDAARGAACEPCLTSARDLLGDLPRKLTALPLMLMPGQSPGGERVTTSRVGSPTTARLDALNLVGPGAEVPMQPLVQTWSTSRVVDVQVRVGPGQYETHETVITEWHQEVVTDEATGDPVMVPDGDQTGIMPPAAWLDQWARRWREALGHKPPARVRVRRRDVDWPALERWALTVARPEMVATLALGRVLLDHWRRGAADLVVGNEPGHAGARPDTAREVDPVGDQWDIRFGAPAAGHATASNITYLATWLDAAADSDRVDLAAFVAGLRTLSAELSRVLGEKPDNEWLGKCPAEITDRADGSKSRCGAGLWKDPYASVVECQRCHSTWGPLVINLMRLRVEIRRVTPLDRRWVYSSEETRALSVQCPDCTDELTVHWQDVTAADDRRRRWRPIRTTCPQGCERQDIL